MGIARLCFVIAAAILSAGPVLSSPADDALALTGSPRLAVFALSQPERSLQEHWGIRRILYSMGFEGRVLRASKLETHISPFARYDSNLNGGFPVSSVTIGGLTFQIDPDAVRKKGLLLGLAGDASFAMPLANGLALTGAGRVEIGYAPDQHIDKTQLSGNLCVERMFSSATWLSGCLGGYKQVFDLGQNRGLSGSLALTRELRFGKTFTEVSGRVSRRREFAGSGYGQNLMSIGVTSALPNGIALNGNVSLGSQVEDQLVMRNRVEVGVSALLAGRPTSISISRQESRGSLYLGQPRKDRTVSLQIGRSLPARWSAEVSYSRTQSSADVFDDSSLGLSISRRF